MRIGWMANEKIKRDISNNTANMQMKYKLRKYFQENVLNVNGESPGGGVEYIISGGKNRTEFYAGKKNSVIKSIIENKTMVVIGLFDQEHKLIKFKSFDWSDFEELIKGKNGKFSDKVKIADVSNDRKTITISENWHEWVPVKNNRSEQ